MISPWEWADYRLLVIVKNRFGTYQYLLDQISQEDFFQRYAEFWSTQTTRDYDKAILDMTVQPLKRESFEIMEDWYKDAQKME